MEDKTKLLNNLENFDIDEEDVFDTFEEPNAVWKTKTYGKIISRPQVKNEKVKEILKDLNFSKGFKASLFHSNSAHGKIAGILDYNGDKADGEPIWSIGQYGCTKDIVSDSTFTRDGNILTYKDGAKTISVDTAKTGCITLGIKGSTEFGFDDNGGYRERENPLENWPHLIINQELKHDITPNVKHLYMNVDYKVNKCYTMVDRNKYPVEEEMHAGQYQWFISMADTNPKSESYKSAMWFGFSMFDTRHENSTPKGYACYDGGKEDCTGLFIYMPKLTEVAKDINSRVDSVPTSIIGKRISIKFDILPFLKKALEVSKEYGAMKGADVNHLRITGTNIGWELPGNYDVKVKIYSMNMFEVL